MRKFSCLTLVILMLVSLLLGCNTGAPNDSVPTTEPTEEETMPTEFNILFIGNSYTNDLVPRIFKEFAAAAGYTANTYSVVQGSWTLTKYADPTDQYGKQVESHLTGNRQYNYVVLQEMSLRPATDEVPMFYAAVRNLNARIEAAGAKTILYSTWGRKTGSTALPQYGLTNESMTWKVASAYKAIGEELDIPVAYVGLAFFDIYTGNSGIEIYDPDRTHPNYAGNYIAALTLFCTISGIDPTTVDYNGIMDAERGTILREAVRKAVFETPEIPEEYKTSSEGIG